MGCISRTDRAGHLQPNISMRFKWKQPFLMGLSAAMVLSCLSGPALALEYTYGGNSAGETFSQSTSTDENYVGNNGQIVVGTDGTISSGVTGNQTSGPLSSVDLPVGEYPEAFGFETDLDIAGNSVFPNELGPTTQNSNVYVPTFIPTVDSGALPTGNSYYASAQLPAAYVGAAYYGYGVVIPAYGVSQASVVGGTVVVPGTTVGGIMPAVAGNGAYLGLATAAVSMPTITKGGAIARLSIPSIGLNKYVYDGTSTANMKKGIAHFDCTSGWLGNIALAGHNRGSGAAFAHLKDLNYGDKVTYTTAYGTLTYVVTEIKTVASTDVSDLQQDGTNKLTMYTCKANEPDVKLCVIASLVG